MRCNQSALSLYIPKAKAKGHTETQGEQTNKRKKTVKNTQQQIIMDRKKDIKNISK